jgi:hypothetical protein
MIHPGHYSVFLLFVSCIYTKAKHLNPYYVANLYTFILATSLAFMFFFLLTLAQSSKFRLVQSHTHTTTATFISVTSFSVLHGLFFVIIIIPKIWLWECHLHAQTFPKISSQIKWSTNSFGCPLAHFIVSYKSTIPTLALQILTEFCFPGNKSKHSVIIWKYHWIFSKCILDCLDFTLLCLNLTPIIFPECSPYPLLINILAFK